MPNPLIRSVTEQITSIESEKGSHNGVLKRVPECGEDAVYHNCKFFPEVTLVTTQAIREYLESVWKQYQSAPRRLKTQILDELTRNLEIHRKSATRLMGRKYPPRSLQGFKGGRRRKYSDRAKWHLERLWRAMGFMWQGRLKAALPDWLCYDDHPDCDDGVRSELLQMSVSSIGRFLETAKARLRRTLNTGTYRGVKRFVTEVPVRGLGQTPTEPGHCEVDSVAHCGSSMSGVFAWTINLTDIATGWTESEAVWGKDGKGVRRALELIEKRLPFKLRGLYVDNGSEFLNEDVIDGFARDRKEPLIVERGRPYKKNDQAYVEQKNYTHVRHLMGYGRIDNERSVPHMNSIYRCEWRKLQNFFMPQQKLERKLRIGSRILRKMGQAATPYSRLRALADATAVKALDEERSHINPFKCRHNQRIKIKRIFGYYPGQIHTSEWGKMAL